MIFDEMIHMGMETEDQNLGFLMMISFFKDDFLGFMKLGLKHTEA